MKRTFATVVPDRIGAFLSAGRCLTDLGLNITRVSYNKAVDVHMLFIEADGDEADLDSAEEKLRSLGYIRDNDGFGEVVLIEFCLRDKPGTLVPVLELIKSYGFSISYMSSQASGRPYQYFKLGLFADDSEKLSEFMSRAAMLCSFRVLEYSRSEKVLDNTVFYLSFAEDISEKAGLDDEEKKQLIIYSNLIMQMLDDKGGAPYKTFDYIARFADMVRECRGDGFVPRISRHGTDSGAEILLIEPPCGSNVCVLRRADELLFIDSGFRCFADELWEVLRCEIRDFDSLKRSLILTHSDVDHCGCADRFDTVYGSARCLENYQREHRGGNAWREENPLHAPFAGISKLLTEYVPPRTDNFHVIGDRPGDSGLLDPIGTLGICGFDFEIYEGAGGHVPGEIVLIERRERLAFTGDIFINVKGCTKTQAAFNRLAPYLMTSVDTDPNLARSEREALTSLLGEGIWRIFGGHGSVYSTHI